MQQNMMDLGAEERGRPGSQGWGNDVGRRRECGEMRRRKQGEGGGGGGRCERKRSSSQEEDSLERKETRWDEGRCEAGEGGREGFTRLRCWVITSKPSLAQAVRSRRPTRLYITRFTYKLPQFDLASPPPSPLCHFR